MNWIKRYQIGGQLKSPYDYIKSYHESPKFKERYRNLLTNYYSGLSQFQPASQSNQAGVNKLVDKNMNFVLPTKTNLTYNKVYADILGGTSYKNSPDINVRKLAGQPVPEDQTSGSHYDPTTNRLFLYQGQINELGTTPEEVAAHEFSHTMQEGLRYPKTFMDSVMSKVRGAENSHDKDFMETKSDIDALRYIFKQKGIYDAGTEDFTPEHLKKFLDLKQNNFFMDRLRRLYSDEDLVNLMNVVAQNKTENQNNSFLARKGGIIKAQKGNYIAKRDATQVNKGPILTLEQLEELQRVRNGEPSYLQYKAEQLKAKQKAEYEDNLKKKGQTKIGNFFTDLGTGVATWGTQFRPPTDEEIKSNREGWKNKSGFLATNATYGLVNEMIPKAGEKLVEGMKSLKNIVPKKFTPNPEAYYRMIGGEEGFKDLQSSGLIRPNQEGIFANRKAYYTKGTPNDVKNPITSGGAKKGTYYRGPYMVEVNPGTHMPSPDKSLPQWEFGATTVNNHIPISNPNVKVYKQNWLHGYKEVPINQTLLDTDRKISGSSHDSLKDIIFHYVSPSERQSRSLIDAHRWIDNWYSNPEIKSRLKSFGKTQVPRENLSRGKIGVFTTKENNIRGLYSTTDGVVINNKLQYPEEITSTGIHELTHEKFNGTFPSEVRTHFNSTPTYLSKTGEYKGLDAGKLTKQVRYLDYLKRPTESHARLNQIRYEHDLNPGEFVNTQKALNIYRAGLDKDFSLVDPEWFKQLKSPVELKHMLNKFYIGTGVAAGVGVAKKQKGGSVNRIGRYQMKKASTY